MEANKRPLSHLQLLFEVKFFCTDVGRKQVWYSTVNNLISEQSKKILDRNTQDKTANNIHSLCVRKLC